MLNNVELVYNPYRNESKITINGSTISSYGEVSNYLKEPFSKWYMKILGIIGREINDDFALTFVSGKIETDIMRMIAEKNESCVSFKAKPFLFDETIYDRATKLSEELFLIGFSPNAGPTCNCNFFFENEEFYNVVLKGFENTPIYKKLGDDVFDIEGTQFYNVLCNLRKVNEIVEHTENELNIYVTSSLDTQIPIRENASNVLICVGHETKVINIDSMNYKFEVDKERLFEYLSEIIGYIFVCPCFVQAITYFKQKQPVTKDAIALLDAIEPMICVKCDGKTLEVGQQCDLKVDVIPKNATKPEYDVKVSNDDVVRFTEGKIIALNQGTALVEVCLKGTIEPVFSTNMSVVKLNRVQTIDVADSIYSMGIGDERRIDFTYSPRDATDIEEIKFNSTNESVAIVDSHGVIQAITPGECKIKISTICASACIKLTVKPKLQAINLSNEVLNMLVGQERELDFVAWPIDAIDKDIEYAVEDSSVAEYNGRIVKGKSFGSTKIIFRHQQTGVTAECNVEVKSTLQEKNKLNIFKILSFILFVTSLIFISKTPINYGVAVAGILLGIIGIGYEKKIVEGKHTMLGTPKKPEIVGCIIGIILNIVAIAISVYV